MPHSPFSKKQPNADGFFHEGPQGFSYTMKKPLFEKSNGLCFRLVNEPGQRWAFYNDTKKYEFHITVTFGAESRHLQALGNTSLSQSSDGSWVASVVVYPLATEEFVQGEVVGFDLVAHAVLLTTEYAEARKAEKREAKKAAKEAKKVAASD